MSVVLAAVPPGFVEIASWPLGDLSDLAPLRDGLHRTLTGGAAPPDRHLDAVVERVVLVASELATNALRHGLPPTSVHLLSDGRDFVVDVVDRSPGTAPVVARHRPPGAGGFGLMLARRAASAVGWYRSGAGEKHVWARFDVPVQRAGAGARSALLPLG